MDRLRQKSKKDKPIKYMDKEKPNMYISDAKTLKENIKITEILRTVKMNSSMRIKAPRGSKVMQNKDFSDNDSFGAVINDDGKQCLDSLSTRNSLINDNIINIIEVANKNCVSCNQESNTDKTGAELDKTIRADVSETTENKTNSQLDNSSSKLVNGDLDRSNSNQITPTTSITNEYSNLKSRERKLSLDHTMLMRRDSLSQSEMDLHSIGKSPLERKSSFFRKKWESFKKNASESFKKQSLGRSQSQLDRCGSVSVSMQSLNEKSESDNTDCCLNNNNDGSVSSLQSSAAGQSSSSLSVNQGERLSPLPGEQNCLPGSLPNGGMSTGSINCLNDTCGSESLLNSRAISMSSGLDTAVKRRRRKTSLANRVTWLASENMTNYLRKVIPDDTYTNNKETPMCHSYQDLVSISKKKTDNKGRRLSYQRAVSGEDPVLPSRYQESGLRRRPLIPEDSEADYELSNLLAEFTKNGVPPLKGFCVANVHDEALRYVFWAENPQNLEELYDIKKLSPNEEARQAVIRELIVTEADYIRHLMAIVEVFIAAAHALQDSGKLLEVDTERLFSNIPDVLNASLYFWEITIYPMLLDSAEKSAPFNTEFMAQGFCRFRDLFQPYEKYVSEQTKALDYLRSLSSNSDFMMYLTWCHSQKSCNRLQLSDIMVKPMQRLTKYSLILRRVIAHTDAEPERTSLIAMESFSKNYVLDLNRSIRQREELERLEALANSIDAYELDFKDEDMDKYFRQYAQLNLKAPMVNCLPSHSRTLIHQGDLRFKDNINPKEIEVRVVLLTDMLLVCKKQLSKNSAYPFKLIRPKYMVDKLLHFPKCNRNSKEISALIFVMLDDVGSATHAFSLSETNKDPNSQGGLKLWEQKVKEAKLTYELGVWFAKNPSRDLSEVEMDSSSDYGASGANGTKPSSDDVNIEREARERVAAMLHRSMGASTDYDFSQASMTTDSFDGEASGTSAGARSGAHSLRHPMHRNSTGGSSRNSRLSSFHQSTSAASHDEPQAGPSKHNYRAGSSVEHLIPPFNPEDAVTSITVNVVSESESETVVPAQPAPQPGPSKPPSPNKLTLRSSSSSHNTLRVQPQNSAMALVHSLPDLTIDPSPPRPVHPPNTQSASEKLYQSHQELLQRNRLSASQHHQYLSPDHRGTSYPPPSPTRASLKRGLAFSYSFKNPPLSKMGHVNSQSQLQAEAGPSTSQQAKAQNEKASTSAPVAGPSSSNDKGDKKSKHVSSSSFFSSGGWHSKIEG
ncbi:uncharacterized protein LOC113520702 isoform X2 [Galleria mellonella]|uniref:Uncharacterized protein LOC113520702 isoform X2 n=1 Tax=Galleria mellonella TaxID=7137 RepID=A0ABM3MNI3_GALME|nr:uncharacterized protein LOC113520702 isoform X2 [Galleria mellonella]